MRALSLACFSCCTTVLLMTFQYVQGQQQEVSLVHFDKPYYVAGEIINYQVFLPMTFRDQKPTLEALVYDFNGVVIHQSFLKKEKQGISSGFFKIAYDIAPGVHQLIINALDEKDQKASIVHAPLPIYGASVPREYSGELALPSSRLVSDFDLDVDIRLQPERIFPRDQVKLTLTVKDRNGSPVKAGASVSIKDIGIIGAMNALPYRTVYSTPASINPESTLSGAIPVSGRLVSRQKGALLTFYMPSANKIYYSTTGDNGNFQLLLLEFYGEQDLHYLGQFSDDINVDLTDHESIEASEPLFYDESIASYIDESKRRRNIYQLYNLTEPMQQYNMPESSPDFIPDREYNARNYPFQDLPSFCKGFSTQLKYMKDKEQGYQFKIFDPETRNFLVGTPLFIVDGQPTKNTEYLASLNFQEFDRIMMFYDDRGLSEYFGFAGYGGVVKIVSKEGNLWVPESASTQEFQVSGLQPVPVEPDIIETDRREPLFKPQLIWKSALETDAQGKLEFDFRQSDDVSTFQIEVVAQSKDGRRGHGTLEYQVHTGLSNSSR